MTDDTPKRVTSSDSAIFDRRETRKRRYTAHLVQWIEEHPFDPYPHKAEKPNLASLAGMTTRQLNDWFSNARRNIKRAGSVENWLSKRNRTWLGSGSNSSVGGTSEGEGGKWHSAYCVCMHEPLHCCLAGAATGRMAYNQAAGGYCNYLVANKPMQGAAAAATPPGTPALGGLPFHAFNPTMDHMHAPLVFSDSTGCRYQCRYMAPTFFTPTAGYTSGTPPAFLPAPCSAGNDDTTDQSSPENHGSIKSTSSSTTAS